MSAPRRPDGHRSSGARGLRLALAHRRAGEITLVALAGTGLAWLCLHWLVDQDCEGADCLAGWMRPLLALHGALAMAALVFLGSVFEGHVLRAWQAARNRLAGAVLLGCMTALVISGWGLYYLGGEAARAFASVLHWVLGLAAIPAFLVHLLRGRRALRPLRTRRPPPA
jgi:hypothetical protein